MKKKATKSRLQRYRERLAKKQQHRDKLIEFILAILPEPPTKGAKS